VAEASRRQRRDATEARTKDATEARTEEATEARTEIEVAATAHARSRSRLCWSPLASLASPRGEAAPEREM